MLTESARIRHTLGTQVLLVAGVAGPVVFVLTYTVRGWLRPGYSSMVSAISDLGVGDGAWIQNANFLLFGALLIAYAVGYRRVMSELIGRRATVSSIAIGTAGLGMFGAVAFPAKPPTDLLHFFLGFLVVIVSAMIAAFSGARQFRRVPGWGALARYSSWTGVIGATVWVLTFIALNPASPIADAGIGGLLNRVLAVVAFGWYTVTGWWLLRRPRVSNVDVQSR
jgi:hypothetical membrane protein